MIGAQLDAFTLEILRSYLVSTVREMVATTTRTAYSTCFAHGEDFTCGLFDAEGRLIAQDQGVPVHAGALGDAVLHVIGSAGRIEPGDVFVHNDPYNGGTHQADGLICRPIFAEGSLVGFAANRGHWTDIGGMAPGGWSGSAEDVYQEALIIPTVRLFAGGEVVEDVRRMILRNVRLPVQLWGDIQAQIASNVVAERRIAELVRKHGRDGFDAIVEATLDYSRKRFHAGLEQLADGVAVASDVIEDDGRGSGPLTITVKVTKTPERVEVDFTGTDPQALAPVNSTLACTKAAVICSLVAILDADIPLNAGVVESLEIKAPPGTLVNPISPAPAFGATADPSDRVSEALLRALAQLAPERAPAGSYSTGNNVTGGGLRSDGSQFLWYSYQAGGCGARPWADGNSAEWHLMSNSRNESMEVWETRYPVEFLSFGLIPDSGGAGRHRGGLGTERRLRITEPTRLSGISDHHRIGAVGLQGGEPGLPNGFAIERDGKREPLDVAFGLASPSKFANLPLRAGDVFVSIQGGGGGFGDPRERDRDRIQADLEAGYISPAQAARSYGETSE